MARLVDDLLDVSPHHARQARAAEGAVELAEVVDAAVEAAARADRAARPRARACDFRREPMLLDARPRCASRRCSSNLLNNAAKYTPRGRADRARRAKRDGDVRRVAVRDTGIGIRAEMLPRDLRAVRAGRPLAGRAQGGLGIGLTLVRQLVELHGGTIEARSEGSGQGSEFVVRLPLQRVAAEDGETDEHRLAVGRRARVLVVDDNADAAESLALSQLGPRGARGVRRGRRPCGSPSEFRPDVVLLDIGMPEHERLRGRAARSARAVGSRSPAGRADRMGPGGGPPAREEAGFDSHLVKPAPPAQLMRILAESAAASPSARER